MPSHSHQIKCNVTMGDLRYISESTKPDITFASNRLAAEMHNPITAKWARLKRLLRYLAHTPHLGITYSPHHTTILTIYLDSDFANATDRRYYSGTQHLSKNCPLHWTAAKKKP